MFNKKFSDILPNGYQIYMYRKNIIDGVHLILYINNVKLEVEKIKNESIGYIEYIFDQRLLEITILYLNVHKEYQHKGIGTYFLLLISDIYKNICKSIDLDDMTKKAWEKDNIYSKLGFKYINEKPYPEMIGNPIFISNKYNDFYHKYILMENGFFKR
jgi:GNAT superfamily N-acetyltransferase